MGRYKIALKDLEKILSNIYFANSGDSNERLYWTFTKERFPNCEKFWKYFIVPITNRIVTESKDPIRNRDEVSSEITGIASYNYSVFLNLIYCYDHLRNFRLSSFEDFYTHLVSSCDLAEEFFVNIYLLLIECKGNKSKILNDLTKDEFLSIAGKWYDEKYRKLYEDYKEKGKLPPIKLPERNSILDEYFNQNESWSRYKTFSRHLREYRNVIIHNVQIAKFELPVGIKLVPKKEKISNYKKWSDVFDVMGNIDKIRIDFINMTEQMILDIGTIEIIMNGLWEKIIDDLYLVMYSEKNDILLTKYDIELL